MIKWNELSTPEQLDALVDESHNQPILIYKHSTRCSISAASLDRLERKWDEQQMSGWKAYYLDLIANRPASNAVESKLGIVHESPQAIVLHKGKPVYDASHFSISLGDMVASVPEPAQAG